MTTTTKKRKGLDEFSLATIDVAEMLGVSPTTVGRYRDRDRNPLPCQRIGGRYWFARQDVWDWLERENEAPAGKANGRAERIRQRRKSARGRPRKKF